MQPKQQFWRSLGRIWKPIAIGDWGVSHAAYPTVLPLTGDNLRVYFSTRDTKGRSNLVSIDMGLDGRYFEILNEPFTPLLTPGPRGSFDSDGVTATSFIRVGDQIFTYYLGWNVGSSVPFMNTIGLAVSDKNSQNFFRRFNSPIVGRSESNPLTLGYPWVLPIDGGYRMWFGSHLSWGEEWMDMTHIIKSATSDNGEEWLPEGGIVLPLKGSSEPQEFAVSRPCVVREKTGWSMWYARRFTQYKLGYAYSMDGRHWTRHDDLIHFADPPEEWETEARTYPCVFDHRGQRYMLYNGNGYGRDGFGLAILD